MTASADLDHTSFAVRDAVGWAHRLRRELGAVPIAGETLPEFRYLLLYVGTAQSGARIELIEPRDDGFLGRFLDRRGEGPHHLTFTVPDLGAAVAGASSLGARISGEDYDHPSWQEAFLAPDAVHGVVIQLARSDAAYPSPAELLATTRRDVDSFPSSRGATDRTWWTPLWETPAGSAAVLGATHLASTDLAFSRRLFGEVLGAEVVEVDHGIDCHWPSGTVKVRSRRSPGVTGIEGSGGAAGAIEIGGAVLGPDPR